MSDEKVSLPTPAEKSALRKLVRGIVLAQGNLFIKELLRKKDIRIGATKADFESNLLDAINDGKLREKDVSDWLDEVEGWGDQHVYIFRVPDAVANNALWASPAAVEKKLKGTRLAKFWDAKTSLLYPSSLVLTGIYFDREALRFVWHQGLGAWVRTPKMDRKESVDGDRYEFRAYRERLDRLLMRFEMRIKQRLAAVFMQIPWDPKDHRNALKVVADAIKPLVSLGDLDRLAISTIIKTLDQTELNAAANSKRKITAQRARLSDAGVYVEFANTVGTGGYKESQAVRDVRGAVRPENFTGTNGYFVYHPQGNGAVQRDAKIELFGDDRRVRLWEQLTATEVWEILELLGKSA
ncbi:MAG: hypothetical protein QOH88_3148 [Verrucomicrobiota bacterium]|jgi:hypothetical protein